MAETTTRAKWLNRAITDHGDQKILEAEAAHNELHGKMPRSQAEDVTYANYKRKEHMAAAGHHLKNLRLAIAKGEKKDAEKHSTLYKLHIQAMGLNPSHPAPPEAEESASKPMTEKGHRFSNHPADILLSDQPLSKAAREYLNCYRLMKADSPPQPIMPAANASPEPKAPPNVKGPSNNGPDNGAVAEAGPQHFAKGSVVVYSNLKGDNYIPPDWIGTVTAHHLIKVHGLHPQKRHYLEVIFRSPDGKFQEDFLDQDELAPYKARR